MIKNLPETGGFLFFLFYNLSMLIRIFIIIIVFYLIAIYPDTSRKSKMTPYEKRFIAHRGLFDNKAIPENSLPAFRKAVANHYGIELDLQLTKDDRVVVFHDNTLERMTGVKGNLRDFTYEELREFHLLDSSETIPLFSDVLKILHPDTPLIIELKGEYRPIETVMKTVELVRNYKGLYIMESFNPQIIRYLRVNEPQIIRGQLSYNYLADPDRLFNYPLSFMLSYLMFNIYTRPDFVAYDCESASNLSFQIISRLFKAECVAWTVKSKEQFEEKKHLYQCFIFDSYIPDNDDLA